MKWAMKMAQQAPQNGLILSVAVTLILLFTERSVTPTSSIELLSLTDTVWMPTSAQRHHQLQVNETKSQTLTTALATAKQCQEMFMSGVEPLSSQAYSNEDWKKLHCDELFCKSTNKNKCAWSKFAIDTLMEPGRALCDAAHVNEFLPQAEWKGYRLSDYLRDRKAIRKERDTYHEKYPGSLVDDFHKAVVKGAAWRDWNAISKIVINRINQTQSANRAPPNTLVIHLRLGDVIDYAVWDPVQELLFEPKYYFRDCFSATQDTRCHEKDHPEAMNPNNKPRKQKWNQYVPPLSYWSNVEELEKFTSVVIMGAAHLGSRINNTDAIRSCQYTEAVRSYFQRRVPHTNVTLRLAHPPDDDVIFAAQAEKIFGSGGGYSDMLTAINKGVKAIRSGVSGRRGRKGKNKR